MCCVVHVVKVLCIESILLEEEEFIFHVKENVGNVNAYRVQHHSSLNNDRIIHRVMINRVEKLG